MTRLRLLLALALSTLAALLLSPGHALADSSAQTPAQAPDNGIPICSSTPNLLEGLGNSLGLSDGDAKGTIGFSQSSYTVSEDAGHAWLTITRTSTAGQQIIFYGVHQQTAHSPSDFTAVNNTEAILAPGQAACQFPVTIADNGMRGPALTAVAYLYGSNRAALPVRPYNVTLTIQRNIQVTRDPANPLDLPVAPTDGDPLTGAKFYVAPGDQTGAGKAARADVRRHDSADANALSFIANQPTGYRFWYWNTPANPAANVARYLERAEQAEPNTVVELSTYSVVHPPCGTTANPAFTAKYLRWIKGLAQGIGNFRVVLFFELDSVITAPCLTPAQRHIRLTEQLAPAIKILEAADPHLVLYLDAGASDALSIYQAANYLRQAGVKSAQGFFVNATHFQWDTTEIAWGQKVSNLLGGEHFAVSSANNGQGPLLNKHPKTQGVEQTCNPAGRGLGTMSTQTGYTGLDGLLWPAPVGNSGGQGPGCGTGAPRTSLFWPTRAVSLYQNRNFSVSGPKTPLERDGTFVPYSPAFAR